MILELLILCTRATGCY